MDSAPSPNGDDGKTSGDKFLRLFSAMNSTSIAFKLQMALRDSAINSLACDYLSFDADNCPYLSPFRELLYSRTWKLLSFKRCGGVELLLVGDNNHNETTSSVGNGRSLQGLQEIESDRGVSIGARKTSVDRLVLIFGPDYEVGDGFLSNLWSRWNLGRCDLLNLNITEQLVRDFSAITHQSRTQQLRLRIRDFLLPLTEPIFAEWTAFCQSLVVNHPCLEEFEISSDDFPDSYLSIFVKAALRNHKRMKKFTSKGPADRDFLVSLSHALVDFQTIGSDRVPLSHRLESLTIENTRLTEGIDRELEVCCSSLRHAHGLTSLSLENYNFLGCAMKVLVASLIAMPKLSSLSLDHCNFAPQSVTCLCQDILAKNKVPSLRRLTVTQSLIDGISSALVSNTSLETLPNLTVVRGYRGYTMRIQATAMQKFYLDLNRGGRRLLNQTLPRSLWPLILSRSMRQVYFGGEDRHLDVLFCLLRNRIAQEFE